MIAGVVVLASKLPFSKEIARLSSIHRKVSYDIYSR